MHCDLNSFSPRSKDTNSSRLLFCTYTLSLHILSMLFGLTVDCTIIADWCGMWIAIHALMSPPTSHTIFLPAILDVDLAWKQVDCVSAAFIASVLSGVYLHVPDRSLHTTSIVSRLSLINDKYLSRFAFECWRAPADIYGGLHVDFHATCTLPVALLS